MQQVFGTHTFRIPDSGVLVIPNDAVFSNWHRLEAVSADGRAVAILPIAQHERNSSSLVVIKGDATYGDKLNKHWFTIIASGPGHAISSHSVSEIERRIDTLISGTHTE